MSGVARGSGRFLLAAALVAFALAGVLLTAPYMPFPFLILFLAAVVLASWFGGIAPGLFAVLLSTVAVDYYFIPPERAFSVNAEDLPYIAAFVLSALLAAWASSTRRTAETSLRVNAELERRVTERTGELERTNAALRAEMAERKLAEAELRTTQSHLAHATRVATMGELVASIAHEINQPLTGVITNAGACMRWLDARPAELEEARAALQRIARDGERAGGVIRNLRALMKKADPQTAALDLDSVIEDVITVVQSEVRNQSVRLRFEPAAEIPPVIADRVQLQQVILNLMLNGIEAMSETAEAGRLLRIHTQRSGPDAVCVAISDTGCGVDARDADRIFDAFVTTKVGGLGMGLAISRSIVEAHGGRLWLERDPERGTSFRFTVPVARATAALATLV
jgi:C4-dicarboxylate-specific signal transduction histidine kinase